MAVISSADASKNLRAFLDMLAWSEGTDNGKQPTKNHGYDVMVGGKLFDSYADHPRPMVSLPKLGIKSSAAGRYQLLSKYFDHYKKQLDLIDFSPEAQDRIAIQQIKECKALADIDSGRLKDAIAKCKRIWASLPGAGYGQKEHRFEDLAAKYSERGGSVA